jgi:phytoene dehydrogenase-like protein
MNNPDRQDNILIVGAGFAGLAAGIYARMNGYKADIFEMHDQPGGLCTSWKRKGYTIDGCIHWLVGSSPKSSMYEMWQEVGIAKGMQIINMDEYLRFEGSDGRQLIFHTDLNRMEEYLLKFSPQDEVPLRDFLNGIRMCLAFDRPAKNAPASVKLKALFRMISAFAWNGRKMKRWMNTSALDFSNRLKDPLLREAFLRIWFPDFSMFFILFTFAFLHMKNAGYPMGGSMPMSKAMADRFEKLGGTIHYKSKTEKILWENGKAVGIRLADGTEIPGSRIISAADGHTTLYKMLDGKFGDAKTFEPYEKWEAFPGLLYVGIGVNRSFNEEPLSVSGSHFELDKPVIIGGAERTWISYHIFNHDPSMAPAGKSAIVVMLKADYHFWKQLSEDKTAYDQAREEAGKAVIQILDKRFPGLAGQTEMIDVATPVTFERYTGNWKGSFEGWLITPGNSGVLMKPMKQTLSGLKNFYMCGQWVEPGGGLPTSVMSAHRLIRAICREDNKKFKAQTE